MQEEDERVACFGDSVVVDFGERVASGVVSGNEFMIDADGARDTCFASFKVVTVHRGDNNGYH